MQNNLRTSSWEFLYMQFFSQFYGHSLKDNRKKKLFVSWKGSLSNPFSLKRSVLKVFILKYVNNASFSPRIENWPPDWRVDSVLINNGCKIFIFNESVCYFHEVPIFDFALSKFHILKGDPIFWQYINACSCQFKHHFRVLIVINLNIG